MRKLVSELRLYVCNKIVSHIPSHSFRLLFYRKIMNFQIGEGSSIHMNCKFDSTGNLWIGKCSVINPNCRFDTRGEIRIGDNVSISNDVFILTADHDLNAIDFASRKRPVYIEKYVWIGTRSTLLPGIFVGEGAVIAAGAVVSKNVDRFSIVGGVPARKIGSRTENLDYKLFYKRLFQ